MGDPKDITGSSFVRNEAQEPNNLHDMNDPDCLLPSGQATHHAPMYQIPSNGGNASANTSQSTVAIPHNNAGAGTGPQEIHPNASLRPPQMPPSHVQRNNLDGLFTNRHQVGLPSSQTAHLARMHQIPRGEGNTSRVNSPIARAVPHNNVRARGGSRNISPKSRIWPARMIPSHFQPQQPTMPSNGGNAISKVDQFYRFPPHIHQEELNINSNMSPRDLLSNPVMGIPGTNTRPIAMLDANLPAMPIGGNPENHGGSIAVPNQSVHGITASQIQSQGLGRPPMGLRDPAQQLGSNAAVMIPSNSHPKRGDNERLLIDAEACRRREIKRAILMKRNMGMIPERACVGLPDISSTLQVAGQNQVPRDQILQPRGNDEPNDTSLDPFEDFLLPCYADFNELKLPEQSQLLPRNMCCLDGKMFTPQRDGPGESSSSGCSLFPSSDMQMTGQDANSGIDFQEIMYDLLNIPPIQRHDGSLSNIRGPNDPLFLPSHGKQCTGFASPPIGDLSYDGSTGLGRSPDESDMDSNFAASNSISGSDQPGKSNLLDEGESTSATKKRKLSAPVEERPSQTPLEELPPAASFMQIPARCHCCGKDISQLKWLKDPVIVLPCHHPFLDRCLGLLTPPESNDIKCPTCSKSWAICSLSAYRF